MGHYVIITTTQSRVLDVIELQGPRYKCMISLSLLVNKLADRNSNHPAASSFGFHSDYKVPMWPETKGT